MISVDWQRVADALLPVDANSIDMRAVREMIEVAHDEWFADDAQNLLIEAVEQTHLLPGNPPYKYIVDLQGTVLRTSKWMDKRGIKVGHRFIMDFKTSPYNFDGSYGRTKFVESYSGSRQPVYYMAAQPVDFFWFRGISKEPRGGTHEFVLWPQKEGRQGEERLLLEDDLASVWAQINHLNTERPGGPWHKNLPDACRKYGMLCPHHKACTGPRSEDPSIGRPFEMPAHLSFSSIQAFTSCQDRYRRDRLINIENVDEGSEASRIGTAFHLGIAALYSQLIHPIQ